MLETLLWDVDGTLLDFLKSEDWALRRCLKKLGVAADAGLVARYSAVNRRHWLALERGEMTREQVLLGRFTEFFEAQGIVCADVAAFNRDYQEALGMVIYPNDGAVELVARLRGRVRQYAVTNGSARAQYGKLRLSGLDKLLDGVFISEELGAEKPDPAFFQKVFAAIGPIDRQRTAILGDSLTSDMLGGLRAGILRWWYNPSGEPPEPNIPVHRVLHDLREVEALLETV